MKNITSRLTFIYTFSLLSTMPVHAQDLDSFNKVYTKTYLETAQQNFPEALHIADSLYSISQTPLLQARSLMLTATLYQQRGETIKSIEYALKAEGILQPINEINWKTRIYGFLATQYRIARLFTPAKEYVEKATATAKKIKNEEAVNYTMGLIMQEMSYHEMAHKRYREAIAYIRQSAAYFEKTKQPQASHLAENEQLLGLNHYLLEDMDKSLEHYQAGLTLSATIPKSVVAALIHNGLANIFLKKDSVNTAKEHLSAAQHIAAHADHLALKKEVNETAYRYYTAVNDVHNMLIVKRTQDSIMSEIYTKSANFVDNSYTQLGLERQDIKQQSKSKTIFLIMGILGVLPIALYFFIPPFKTKSKNEGTQPPPQPKAQSKETTTRIHEEQKQEQAETSIPETESTSLLTQPTISEQAVNKILKRLNEFEKKHLYIKRDISLSYLAIYCDTNAKYLSIVINTHKKKDFYNYINEFRINYIVDKLQNDPYYQRLKIAALAQEAGFSSQSKFAVNFKKIMGMSPSEFVNSLPKR